MDELNNGIPQPNENEIDNNVNDQQSDMVNDTTNTNTNTDIAQEQPKIRIKYNHEERELTYDEAVQLAQKGMNYDKIYQSYEEYRNDPAFQYVQDLAKKNRVNTKELVDYWRRVEEQEALNQLTSKDPEDLAREALEGRRYKEMLEQQEREQQEREQRVKDYQTFLQTYPHVNVDQVPDEVWLDTKKGLSLVDAYAKYDYKILKSKFDEIEKSKQVSQVNMDNANSSTGGITGGSIPVKDYYTRDEVAAMSPDEIKKNMEAIDKSMKRWS